MLLERYITTRLDLLHHFSYFLLHPSTNPLKQVYVLRLLRNLRRFTNFLLLFATYCGLLLMLGKAIHANLPYHLT
jgi:hypothetical protein